MKISEIPIVTTIEEAKWLLEVDDFAVDIETNTETDDLAWEGKDYGLSVLAEPTYIGFYNSKYPAVSLDTSTPDRRKDVKSFIQKVFNRESYRVVAHNAIFDLRNLGTHFQFNLPHSVRVWDTQVMSVRLTISDGRDDDKAMAIPPVNFQPSSLESLVKLHKLLDDEETWEFWERMKKLRAQLHTASSEDVSRYVTLDTILTYLLYKDQQRIVDTVYQMGDKIEGTDKYRAVIHEPLPGVKIISWPEVKELVESEEELSTISAQSAIRGVLVDGPYIMQKFEEYGNIIEECERTLLTVKDPTDAIYDWDKNFNMMWWAHMVLEGIKKVSSDNKRGWAYKESITDVSNLTFWERMPNFQWLNMLKPYLFFDEPLEDKELDSLRDQWVLWLMQSDETWNTGAAVRKQAKSMEGIPVPFLDYVQWALDNSLFEGTPLECEYRFILKMNYHLARVSTNRPYESIIRLQDFEPYVLFVMSNLLFPDDEDLRYVFETTTESAKKKILSAKDENGVPLLSEDDDALEAVLSFGKANPGVKLFSTGYDTVSLLIRKVNPDIEEDEIVTLDTPAAIYYRYQQAKTARAQAEEYLRHASYTGRIHSKISRLTRTGRFSSTTPNNQNPKMDIVKGFMVGDPDFELCEFDLSNAENKSGASISGDNAFAVATEGQDFHMAMAEVYFSEEIKKALEKGDRSLIKKIRSRGKNVTFAGAYGAGARKIASMIRQSLERAKEILAAKDAAFPLVARAKSDQIKRIRRLFNQYQIPVPYVSLWSGARVRIPVVYQFKGAPKPKENAVWNYLQQGAVAEMIKFATILVNRALVENGYKSYIAFNIHDSLIVAIHKDEWPFVPQLICQIMSNVFPEKWARRTNPWIHMHAEIGPENARKWGWRYNKPYMFPLDKFVNQWGEFDLPEGAVEAPAWNGPEHLGWTLKQEMEDIAAGITDNPGVPRSMQMAQPESNHVDVVEGEVVDEWFYAQRIMEFLPGVLENISRASKKLEGIDEPVNITSGETVLSANNAAEKGRLYSSLTSRGYRKAATTLENWEDGLYILLTHTSELAALLKFVDSLKQTHGEELTNRHIERTRKTLGAGGEKRRL